ncbi:hypothetical protein MMC22_007077 [Lobaria immixta]|nr:hypothetical protein [Lobaria immixta]
MSESYNQPFVNPTVRDHEPDVDEAISRDGAVSKVISTSSGPGLLDLPPEKIDIGIYMHRKALRRPRENQHTDWVVFVKAIHLFGNPSIIRRNLLVRISIEVPDALKWFVGALGRFTNFVTIDLRLDSWFPPKVFLEWSEYLKTALEPVLGYADEYKNERNCFGQSIKCFRFHPVEHRNRSGEPNDADWADSLDGIRLGWNQTLTDTEDSGMPTQE